jgi:hypothetical protein
MENPTSIKKRYKIRQAGDYGKNYIVTIPPVVIQVESSKRQLTVEQFVSQYDVVVFYDPSTSAIGYAFTLIKVKGEKDVR